MVDMISEEVDNITSSSVKLPLMNSPRVKELLQKMFPNWNYSGSSEEYIHMFKDTVSLHIGPLGGSLYSMNSEEEFLCLMHTNSKDDLSLIIAELKHYVDNNHI